MDQHMLPVRISYFILNRLARARQTTPEGIHYFPWYMDISVPSGDILIETFGLSLGIKPRLSVEVLPSKES